MIEVYCVDGTDPRQAVILIDGIQVATVSKGVYDILLGPLGLPLWPCGEG